MGKQAVAIRGAFPEKRGKVLVLGRDDRSCLSVVRSLGRQGLEVHLAWSIPGDVVRHSKYIRKIHDIPAYQPDHDAWKESLLSLFNTEGYDLVLPCSDPTAFPLQHHRSDFEPHAQVYLLDDNAFKIVSDKIRLYKLAQKLGINIPKSEKVSSLEHLKGLSERLGFPLVLKPRSSFRMENLQRKNHVWHAENEQELRVLLERMLQTAEFQAQSYFRGRGLGI